MNTAKMIIYIIITIILFFMLIKSLKLLFSSESYENEKTEVNKKINPEKVKEVINEIVPTEKPIDTPITQEIDMPESTQPIESEIEKSIDNTPIISDNDFKEIVEQPIISAQGEIIKKEESMYETQQDQKREDPEIEPRYFDAKTETIIDGVKIIPHSLLSPWADAYSGQSNNYLLDTGDDADGGSMRYTKRSPACCSPTYPPPFKLNVDSIICKDKDNYMPNPYTGSDNWSNAGCSCATKKNILKLAHRGGNA